MTQAPHVLIVDDLPQIVHPLAILLRHDGYRVTLASHVLPLDVVRDLTPDLIVLDLLSRGSEQAALLFLRALRDDRWLGAVPVLMSTVAKPANSEPVMTEEMQQLGVRVVLKPVAFSAFLRAFVEIVESAEISARHPMAIIRQRALLDPSLDRDGVSCETRPEQRRTHRSGLASGASGLEQGE